MPGAAPSMLMAGLPGSQLPQQLPSQIPQMQLPLVAKAAGTPHQMPQPMPQQPPQQTPQLQQPQNLVGSCSQPARPIMPSTPGQPPISPASVLLAIRQGVAAQDREMVKKAVAAAKQASVPLEPHVRAMLQQWLGETPVVAPPATPAAAVPVAAAPAAVPAPATNSVGCPTGTLPTTSV